MIARVEKIDRGEIVYRSEDNKICVSNLGLKILQCAADGLNTSQIASKFSLANGSVNNLRVEAVRPFSKFNDRDAVVLAICHLVNEGQISTEKLPEVKLEEMKEEEARILGYMCAGFNIERIAEEMGLFDTTAKKKLTKIYEKLGTSCRYTVTAWVTWQLKELKYIKDSA